MHDERIKIVSDGVWTNVFFDGIDVSPSITKIEFAQVSGELPTVNVGLFIDDFFLKTLAHKRDQKPDKKKFQLKAHVSITDMELFKDFAELLTELADEDNSIKERLNSILAKNGCNVEVD